MDGDPEEQLPSPSYPAAALGTDATCAAWQVNVVPDSPPPTRRSASPASSSSASGSFAGPAVSPSLGIGNGGGSATSFPSSGNAPRRADELNLESSDRPAKVQKQQQQQVAVASSGTGTGVAALADSSLLHHCPVCKLSFGRLRAHLQRNPVCGEKELGRETLRQLLMLSARFKRSHKKGGTAKAIAVAAAAAKAMATAAAAAGGVLCGSGGGGDRGCGGSGSQPREKLCPCPLCGKFFLRVGHHLRMSDCKKVLEWPANKKARCNFCDEAIAARWDTLKAHSKACALGIAAAARREADVLAAAEAVSVSVTAASQQVTLQVGAPSTGSSSAVSSSSASPPIVGATSSSSWSSSRKGGSKAAVDRVGGLPSTSSSSCGGSGGGLGGARNGAVSPLAFVGRPPHPPSQSQQQPAAKPKRRGSGGSSNSIGGSGSGRRGSTSLTERQRSVDSMSSFSGRALGSDSDSSDSEMERMLGGGWGDEGSNGGFGLGGSGGSLGSGGGGRYGFGTGAGSFGSILGATRKPMPPKKRWETELEAWAEGGWRRGGGVGDAGVRQGKENARGDSEEGSGAGGVEKRYPCLMDRAEESALVTVREVREFKGEVEANGEGGLAGRACEWEAVVECSLEVRVKMLEEKSKMTGETATALAATMTLGLEISSPTACNGRTSASELALESALASASALEDHPRVSSVTEGGPADRAGIARGAAILEVEGASMQRKTAADVMKSLSNALKKRPKGCQACVRVVIVTPAWPSPPSPSPSATKSGAGREAMEVAGLKTDVPMSLLVGGMACLGREHHRGREFMEMCWSVLMHPEGGIPPPTRGGAHMAALGERPAEEEEEIVGRLGFDVVRRDLSEGMECIEVATVKAGGLAARHGLRIGDLILALDGRHLLSCSEPSFWLEVGRLVRACDVTREQQQQHQERQKQKGAAAADGNEMLPNSWLRFLVVRKGSAAPSSALLSMMPSTAAPLATLSTAAPSTAFGGGTKRAREGVPGGRGAGKKRKVGKGGRGEKSVAKGRARGKGGRGRGKTSQQSSRKSREQTGSAAEAPAATKTAPKATAAAPLISNAAAPPPSAPSSAVVSSVAGAGAGGAVAAPAPSSTPLPSTTTTRASAGGAVSRGGEVSREERVDSRKRREARKRPAWWLPQEKGSYRCVLSLRPADALPGAVAGAPVPPGAFLLEDARLGDAMTIPAGSKLVSVDGKSTAELPFDQARQVAMAGGKDTVLAFE